MIAELISVGTELLMGQILDTNSQYLSQELNAMGFDVYYKSTVGDNPERMKQAFALALSRSDIVITTGGLGPTEDDITKEMMAEQLDIPLVLHQPSLEAIQGFFARIGQPMTKTTENRLCCLWPRMVSLCQIRKALHPAVSCIKTGSMQSLCQGHHLR